MKKNFTFFFLAAVLISYTQKLSAQTYCTTGLYSNSCTSNDLINSFSTTGGATNITNNNTGCSNTATNYTYYSTMTHTGLQGAMVNFSFQNTLDIWSAGYKIWVDYNNNGSFADPGEEVYASATTISGNGTVVNGNFTIPMTTPPGLKRMRIRCVYNTTTFTSCSLESFGEIEDYNLMVIGATPCSGTPNAGTPALISTCPTYLGLTGNSIEAGVDIQWQTRPSCGGQWTDIPGGTSYTQIINTISQPTEFRAYFVCTHSGLSDTSSVITLTSVSPCYCNSAASNTGGENIHGINIGSWTNSSTCGPGGGFLYTDFTSVTPAKIIRGSSSLINVIAGSCGTTTNSNGAAVFIDYNKNGIFESAERVFASPNTVNGANTFSGTFTVPLNAQLGITGMRVILASSVAGTSITGCQTYSFGETEDYLIDIQYAPEVTGTGLTNYTGNYCSGDDVILTASAPGFLTPRFLWVLPDSSFDTSTVLNLNNIQANQSGSYLLYLLTENCPGDPPDTSGARVITIGVNQTPKKPIVAPVITYCQGDVFDSIPIFGQNLQWFTVPTGGIPGPAPIINTSVFSTATYYVSQTVDGCQSQRAEVTIKVVAKPDPPQVTSPIGFCQGAPALPLQATGQQIRWYSVPAGGVGTPNTPVPSTAAQGTTTWYATQTVEGCESERVPVIVHVSYMPNGQILASRPVVCQTDTLTFKYFGNATDSANYVWTLPTGASLVSGQGQQIIVRFDSAGIQTVKLAVDNNGCAGVAATFDVTVHPTPVVALDFQPDACAGDVISVALSYASMGIDSLAWDFQAGEQVYGAWPKGPFGIRWSEQGLKTVSVVAASRGCISEPATERIHIHGLPDAGITAGTQTGCAGDSILFRAVYEPGATYQWQPAQFFAPGQGPEAWATVLHASMIRLDVVNRYNCKASDSIFVNAQPCCQVYFPTAFSPNGDGTNDYFKMLTLGKEKTAQSKAHQLSVFKVQNRWGQTIFETADETRGWDGTFNGVAQDIGTYYFYVRYKCSDGKFYEQKGEVTLVR